MEDSKEIVGIPGCYFCDGTGILPGFTDEHGMSSEDEECPVCVLERRRREIERKEKKIVKNLEFL